jgi:hypothetical protein
MHALVRFAHIAAGNTFTTAEIHPAVLEALGCAPEWYTLASLRYDLSKLRAKGLVAKLPNSPRYQLLPQGYSICLGFLKLFERVYAPLTVGLLNPWHSIARGDPDPRGGFAERHASSFGAGYLAAHVLTLDVAGFAKRHLRHSSTASLL